MGGRGFEAPNAPSRDAESVEGEWNGRGFPLPSRLGGLGSVVSSPSGVRGGVPAKNGFRCFPSVTECLSLRRLS